MIKNIERRLRMKEWKKNLKEKSLIYNFGRAKQHYLRPKLIKVGDKYIKKASQSLVTVICDGRNLLGEKTQR